MTDGRESTPIGGPALHRALGESSRAAIMALLRDQPGGIDIGGIAAATGLHPNTVRHHVDVLLAAGLVHGRPDPTRTGGRPRRLFRTTRLTGGHDGGEGYPLLAEIMVKELAGRRDGAERAVSAGRHWAQHRSGAGSLPTGRVTRSTEHAAGAVTAMFAELGFEPELVPGPDVWQIRLHHCPFRALARAHQDVVCGIHLGLLHGALAEHDVRPAQGQLAPFVQPSLCIAAVPRTVD